MPNDGRLLNLLLSWISDPTTLERILARNPERLYGFKPIPPDTVGETLG
jgi:hypothetical protein